MSKEQVDSWCMRHALTLPGKCFENRKSHLVLEILGQPGVGRSASLRLERLEKLEKVLSLSYHNALEDFVVLTWKIFVVCSKFVGCSKSFLPFPSVMWMLVLRLGGKSLLHFFSAPLRGPLKARHQICPNNVSKRLPHFSRSHFQLSMLSAVPRPPWRLPGGGHKSLQHPWSSGRAAHWKPAPSPFLRESFGLPEPERLKVEEETIWSIQSTWQLLTVLTCQHVYFCGGFGSNMSTSLKTAAFAPAWKAAERHCRR